MMSLTQFIVFSSILYICFTLALREFYRSNKKIPIIGNDIFHMLLMLLFIGFYGAIFKGSVLIEKVYLYRSDNVQLTALFFALLYIFVFVKFRPKW